MTRLLLVVAIFMWPLIPIYAQEEETEVDASVDSRTTGRIFVEFTGSPFNTDDGTLLEFGFIRARYYLFENLAIRLGLMGSTLNDQLNDDYVSNLHSYSLRPGVEYFFGGQGKVQPYAAAELVYDHQFANARNNRGHFIKGATGYYDYDDEVFYYGDRAFVNLGLNVQAGFNYHINDYLYIGSEIGVGYQFGRMNRVYFSDIDSLEPNLLDTIEPTISHTVRPIITNTFRIGFKIL